MSVQDFLARVPSLAWDSHAAHVYAVKRAEQERTGLPPAYVPKDEREREPVRDADDGGAS